MKVCGRRLYQLALIVIILAFLTNCSLIGGRAKSETWGSGNLRMTLWVSRSLPRVGEPVEIRYTVENTTDRTEVIQLEEKQEPVTETAAGNVSWACLTSS